MKQLYKIARLCVLAEFEYNNQMTKSCALDVAYCFVRFDVSIQTYQILGSCSTLQYDYVNLLKEISYSFIRVTLYNIITTKGRGNVQT